MTRDLAPATTVTTPEEWRRHFPALRRQVDGKPFVYFDSAATTHRSNQVIDAIGDFYRAHNANPVQVHTLGREAAERYSAARSTAARFVGASDPLEVVFTRGTTEAINLVAATWSRTAPAEKREILIGLSEHASNMVPWQLAAKATGATLRYFGMDGDGRPDLSDFDRKLSSRTGMVAFSHVSNVLGMVNSARELCDRARAAGARILIDGAQSVPHFPVAVRALGCDFLAFSGHKLGGPMGIGVLWGRRELLDALPPYQGGSNMAHDADLDGMHLSEGALKFGAGTPNVADAVGLAAALDFLSAIGFDALRRHESALTKRMLAQLGENRAVRLIGSSNPAEKISVFAFTVRGIAPVDAARALDQRGIAVRAGDLASLPLLKAMGETAAVRASCYLYSSLDEVDRFATALADIVPLR